MGLVAARAAAFRGSGRSYFDMAGSVGGPERKPGEDLVNRRGTLPIVEPDGDVVQVPYRLLSHGDLIDEKGEVREKYR